jgi:drug/metabolite transporter (DMT)-like permease
LLVFALGGFGFGAFNLVPIFGAMLAVGLLGESFHLYHLPALVLVLGGIMMAERFREVGKTAG